MVHNGDWVEVVVGGFASLDSGPGYGTRLKMIV